MHFCLCSQRAARARARAAALATRPRRLATCKRNYRRGRGPAAPRAASAALLSASLFTQHDNYRDIVVRCDSAARHATTKSVAPRGFARAYQSVWNQLFLYLAIILCTPNQ